jgi:hypothetical protein
VRAAMSAVGSYERIVFAEMYEPLVARAIASSNPVQPKDKRSIWAVALAEELVRENPDLKFTQLWELIPEDEGNTYEGYEVYREGELLMACNATHNANPLKKDTFRTRYTSQIKNM